jgi:hypothetical protein
MPFLEIGTAVKKPANIAGSLLIKAALWRKMSRFRRECYRFLSARLIFRHWPQRGRQCDRSPDPAA